MGRVVFNFVTLSMSIAVLSQGVRIHRNGNHTNTDCYSKYDGKTLLHLTPCTSKEVAQLSLQFETVGCTFLDDDLELPKGGGCADAYAVCSGAAASLEQHDGVSILSSDIGSFWRETSGAAKPFTGGLDAASEFYSDWRDLDALMARMEHVVRASSGAAKIETAGTSLEGRDMRIVRFTGRGYQPGGRKLFFTFNLHAREWITGMAGVYAVEQLVATLQQQPHLLDGMEVVMMPMSNPDGFAYSTTSERMHRKNMRNGGQCGSVDINRNFDAYWASGGSSSDPCRDTYHGPSAMSEPETNVISKIMKESPMTVYIDVHNFSELIMSAFGYSSRQNPRHAEYRSLGYNIQTAIVNAEGKLWQEGSIAQVLYTASGTTVDYADAMGALGWCFELRPPRTDFGGFAPPVSEILPAAREGFAGILASITYPELPPGVCRGAMAGYETWCINQGRANYCPAPHCTRSPIGEQPTPSPTPPPTPTPSPSTPTPPTPPAPTPPTTSPPTPTPTPPTPPPTGECVHQKDCDVSPWCTDTGFEVWCQNQGQSGSCPAPYCTRV